MVAVGKIRSSMFTVILVTGESPRDGPHIRFSKSSARIHKSNNADRIVSVNETGIVPRMGDAPRKDGYTMSEFANQLDTRIDDVRHRIHEARSEGDDYLVETLIDDLQNLLELAGRNDVDTGPIVAVIAAETGAIPVVSEPEET